MDSKLLPLQQIKRSSIDLDCSVNLRQNFWEELRDKRLFITGGTGFFGCWLLETFSRVNEKLSLNASALVLTRNCEAIQSKAPHLASNPAIEFWSGDVRDFTFPKGEFSHIIHAASSVSAKLNSGDPLLMFDTIVSGTKRTLDFAAHCGAIKFLLTSSGAVYGKQPSGMTHITEDYVGSPLPTDPTSAYGEGKRAAELLCAAYSNKYGIEAKIARCFAFVGPYQSLNMHFAIGNFIRDGLNGGPIVVEGDGTPCRSYLYAADLAVWLWTILLNGKSCRPYNIGSEDSVSIAELAHTVAQCFEKDMDVVVAKPPKLGGSQERYVPSTKRAVEECGVRQNFDLKESLKMTIAFHLGCKIENPCSESDEG